MRFQDELVDAGDLDVPEASRKPTKKEVDMAARIVESLHGRVEPEAFEDTYRERVLELIARKASGKQFELAHPDEGSEPDDLTAALEASLKAVA